MKSPPLQSYLANVIAFVLITYACGPILVRPAQATSAPIPDTGAKVSQPAAHPGKLDDSASWAASHKDAVVESLRRMNAPQDILTGVAGLLLARDYNDRRNAILHPRDLPKWAWHNFVHSEAVEQQLAEIDRQFTEEMARLAGPDYDKTIPWDVGIVVIMPDGLSPEKQSLVTKLYLDYVAAWRNSLPGSSRITRDELEAAYNERLKYVLTPDQMHEYLAYNSSYATNLQKAISGAPLDDRAYLQLYNRLIDYRRTHRPSVATASDPASFVLWAGEFQIVREAIGDAMAAKLARSDPIFNGFAPILAAPDNPTVLVNKYAAYLQFRAGIEQLQKNPSVSSPLDRDQQRASVASAAYAKLTDDLSPAAKAEFDRSQVAMFMHHMMGK